MSNRLLVRYQVMTRFGLVFEGSTDVKRTILGLAAILCFSTAHAQQYNLAVMKLLPGGTYIQVTGLNNVPQIVGYADDIDTSISSNPEQSAVVWSASGTPTVVQHGAWLWSPIANGINNSHVVVGTLDGIGESAGAWCVPLDNCGSGGLPGGSGDGTSGDAYGVNDANNMVGVGQASSVSFQSVAIWWEAPAKGGMAIILPMLPAYTESVAYAINAGGRIVGNASNSTTTHAVLWTGGKMIDLGTLGGAASAAAAINAAGEVVGSAELKNGAQHATAWVNGVAKDLGTLGATSSYATGINTAGDIVGGSAHAVLWPHATGKPVDLTTRISASLAKQHVLSGAVGINDKGDILVQGYNATTHAAESYLLTPQTN